jgi:hypothetical protein
VIESICRVCGYDDVGEERWTGPDGAQYVICPCCGAHSWVQDIDLKETRRYRTSWVQGGCPWFSPEERPADWSFERQAQQIPEIWR